MARLDLQFDVRQVGAYAARYPDEDDTLVLAIGREAPEARSLHGRRVRRGVPMEESG